MIQIWQVPSECGPSNLVVLELGEQESDEQTADEDGFKMKGYAKILHNNTTPLILFVFHE